VVESINKWIQIHHLVAMSFYGKDLKDRILQAIQQDVRYMEILHTLQQSIGTCIGDSTGTDSSDSIGTGIGTSA